MPVNKEMLTLGRIGFVKFYVRDIEYYNDKSHVKN